LKGAKACFNYTADLSIGKNLIIATVIIAPILGIIGAIYPDSIMSLLGIEIIFKNGIVKLI